MRSDLSAVAKRMIRKLRGVYLRVARAAQRRLSRDAGRKYELESLVGPIGYWDELVEYQFSFLRKMGLETQHSFLELGCGPLPSGIPVIEFLEKQKYVGIDVSAVALNYAYQRIAEHDLAAKNPILLYSQEFGRGALSGQTFDYIWVSQLLYHLDEEQLDQLLEQVARCAHFGTVFLGDIMTDDRAHTWMSRNPTWRGLRYHFHSLQRVSELAAPHGLKVEDIGSLEQHGYPKAISLRTNRMLRITPEETSAAVVLP